LEPSNFLSVPRPGEANKAVSSTPTNHIFSSGVEPRCRNSVQLYDEIKARGYPGSASLLRHFLAELRKKHREAGSAEVLTFETSRQSIDIPDALPPHPCVVRRMSPMRASWLLVSREDALDEKQRKDVEQIRKAHPDLERAYHLGQGFVMMLLDASSCGSGHLADPS
jgi:hypothetical protein